MLVISMHTLESFGAFLPGSRIGVLLIHGLAGTPKEMLTVGRRLNRYGFTVLCPQLAGHCATEADLIATTWTDWAESAARAFEALAAQMDAVFVGGLSAGAVLSLHVAQRYPEQVRGQALYSTTLRWDGWSIPKLRFLLPLVLRLPYFGKRYRFKEAYPYGIMNEKLRNMIVAQLRSGDPAAAGLTTTPGSSVRELWRLVDAVKKDLGKVAAPTLLAHARKDDIASLGNALDVRSRLAGPTELLILDNSYHLITVDQERHKVGDASARFFQKFLSPAEQEELASKAFAAVTDEEHDHDEASSPCS